MPDLSPDSWLDSERVAAERADAVSPRHARVVTGRNGLVAATTSPVAVLAGVHALRHGGSAADAAATVALTQIVTSLGSFVSFAGTLQLLHHDASTGKTDYLDAGWSTWLGETDPSSIPTCDLHPLPFRKAATTGAEGRKTLVPGFMAGLEAFHQRLGRLSFAALFQPAIAYAERGIALSPRLASCFSSRGKYLERTPEGRAFVQQCGGDSPSVGDRFVQRDLARTLRAVADEGAAYLYTGAWARRYVEAIQREGGRASIDDMARYLPGWEAPRRTAFHGNTIVVGGASNATRVLEALNLAEALHVDTAGPYFEDPRALHALARILRVTSADLVSSNAWLDWKRARGLTLDPTAHITPDYARALAAALGDSPPSHSATVVAVDAEGNVAVLAHTINTMPWGSTGIVVGGLPISDAAGFQQRTLAALAPGARVPAGMAPLIAFRDDRPVLALASIGSSLVPETVRLAIGALANRRDLATLCAAPPLLESWEPAHGTIPIPDGAYRREFLDQLEAAAIPFALKPRAHVAYTRGTAAIAMLDPETNTCTAAEVPGVSSIAAAR